MPEWSAEMVVDAKAARRLIGAQFPQLELRSMRLLGEGWDNTVWLVDGRWVFRFPRRAVVLPGFERELAMLPLIAPLLPVAVPVPELVGRPDAGFPWIFAGAPFLPGREAAECDLDDRVRIALARPLATFLRALHAIDLTAAGRLGQRLPTDANRRSDMRERVPRTLERFAELRRLGIWDPPSATVRLVRQAHELPPPTLLTLAHGDLHVRHLLIGEDSGLVGVIDWIDICRADPAIDLLLYWSFLPPDGRMAFLEHYGPVSDDQLLRARVLALFLSATLAIYGRHAGMPALENESVGGLERASAA